MPITIPIPRRIDLGPAPGLLLEVLEIRYRLGGGEIWLRQQALQRAPPHLSEKIIDKGSGKYIDYTALFACQTTKGMCA